MTKEPRVDPKIENKIVDKRVIKKAHINRLYETLSQEKEYIRTLEKENKRITKHFWILVALVLIYMTVITVVMLRVTVFH